MNKSIPYVLAGSLNWSGLHLLLDQWFNYILCVSYFTGLHLGSFDNIPVNKSIHYVLAILLGLWCDNFCIKPVNKSRHCVLSDYLSLLVVHLVLVQWFRQTLCVSYFTELVFGSFGNRQVNKSRHYVLAIPIGLFRYNYVTIKCIKLKTMC